MNEPLIPKQIVNPVTPSILSMFNSILSTSMESTMSEFDLSIDDLPRFSDADSSEKYDAANHNNTTTLRHSKEIKASH